MPAWRRCCSKWHFNPPRREQGAELRDPTTRGGVDKGIPEGAEAFSLGSGPRLGCGLRLYFQALHGSSPAACSQELFSPTAKIGNSKLHCKQWRGRLLGTARNSGERAPRLTFPGSPAARPRARNPRDRERRRQLGG